MRDKGLISVIIPCYNDELHLKEAIDSVLQQTYPHVETIVVDDGSTDGSWGVVESYGDQIKGIRLKANQGGGAARNRGFEVSRGQFLMFLDSDDLIAPDTLDGLVKAIGERTDCLGACKWNDLIFSGEDWRKLTVESTLMPPGGDYIRAWLTGWHIPTCAVLWSRSLFEQTGGWDEGLLSHQDREIMVRAFVDGADIRVADYGLASYRRHGNAKISVSNAKSEKAIQSQIAVVEKIRRKLEAAHLSDRYSDALGKALHIIGVTVYEANPEKGRESLIRAEELAGRRSYHGTRMHRLLCHILGPEGKVRVANWAGKYGLNPNRWSFVRK